MFVRRRRRRRSSSSSVSVSSSSRSSSSSQASRRKPSQYRRRRSSPRLPPTIQSPEHGYLGADSLRHRQQRDQLSREQHGSRCSTCGDVLVYTSPCMGAKKSGDIGSLAFECCGVKRKQSNYPVDSACKSPFLYNESLPKRIYTLSLC